MRVLAAVIAIYVCIYKVYSIPECPKGAHWTGFYDRDNPSGTGDWETLKDLRKEKKGICERPVAVDVRIVGYPDHANFWYLGGNYIRDEDRSGSFGFVCKNKLQKDLYKPPCKDYKVRFCCFPEPKCDGGYWSPFYDRDDPSATGDWETLHDLRKKHPALCSKPSAIDARLLNGDPYQLGGDHVDISPTKGLVCENKKQKDHKCDDYKVRFCCHFKEPSCKGEWTQWFDRDNPSGKGDYETLSDLITESKGGSKYYICHKPIGIDARALNPHRPWQAAYENVHISADKGLYCVNNEQSDKKCEDYKVRFCCAPKPPPPKCYWTSYMSSDLPTGKGDYETIENLRKHYKFCSHPLKIHARVVGKKIDARYTKNKFTYYDVKKGFVCENYKQPYGAPPCYNYEVKFYCC
ncbi:mucin-5AC-like [Styela clava]